MQLENLILALIASLNANTAAHGGTVPADTTGAGEATAAATTKPAGKAKPAAAAAPKGPTREEVAAILTKVKEEKGAPVAKGLIKSAGGVEKMNDIAEGKLKAVFDAATAALAEEVEQAGEDDGL